MIEITAREKLEFLDIPNSDQRNKTKIALSFATTSIEGINDTPFYPNNINFEYNFLYTNGPLSHHDDDIQYSISENPPTTPQRTHYTPVHNNLYLSFIDNAIPTTNHYHHNINFTDIFLSQILSLAPPNQTRIQFDCFFTSRITETILPLAPRAPIGYEPLSCNWSLPHPAFLIIFPPPTNTSMITDTIEKFSESKTRGVILLPNKFVRNMLEKAEPNFTLHLFDFQALYYDEDLPVTSNHITSRLTPNTLPHIKQTSTRPIKCINKWIEISSYISPKLHYLCHNVYYGFLIGRSLRFQGNRDHKQPIDINNYNMNPEEITFVIEDNKKSISTNFLQDTKQTSVPFFNGVVNPVFVNNPPFKKPRKIVDHTRSGNNIQIHKQPQSNFSIHNIIRAVRKIGPCCLFIVFDYKSAYKNINTAICDWHLSLEREPITNHILLESRLQWGSSPVGVKWEDVVRLARLLLIYHLHLLILHYVDDVTNIIPPTTEGDYDQNKILDHIVAIQIIHDSLGIEIGKWQFGSIVDVLGFTLNTLLNHTSIQEKRIQKFLTYTQVAISKKAIKTRTLASITGQLISFSFIFPFIKAYLPKLLTTISNRSRQGGWDSFVRISNDLKQLLLLINTHTQKRPTLRLFYPIKYSTSFLIYTDASKICIGWAIPGTFEMRSIPLSAQNLLQYTVDQKLSMVGLEGFAVLQATVDFIHNFHSFTKSLIIYTDNNPFIQAFQKGWSHSPIVNKIITTLQLLLVENDILLTLEWVETGRNLADYPSRFLPSPSNQIVEREGHSMDRLNQVYGQACVWRHNFHSSSTSERNWWACNYLAKTPGLVITNNL